MMIKETIQSTTCFLSSSHFVVVQNGLDHCSCLLQLRKSWLSHDDDDDDDINYDKKAVFGASLMIFSPKATCSWSVALEVHSVYMDIHAPPAVFPCYRISWRSLQRGRLARNTLWPWFSARCWSSWRTWSSRSMTTRTSRRTSSSCWRGWGRACRTSGTHSSWLLDMGINVEGPLQSPWLLLPCCVSMLRFHGDREQWRTFLRHRILWAHTRLWWSCDCPKSVEMKWTRISCVFSASVSEAPSSQVVGLLEAQHVSMLAAESSFPFRVHSSVILAKVSMSSWAELSCTQH